MAEDTLQVLTNEFHDLMIKCETQENTIETLELEYKDIEEEVVKLRIENEDLLTKNELLEHFKKEMDLEKHMFHSSLMEMEAVNKKNVELHEEISQKAKNIQNLNKENSKIKNENKKYIVNMQQFVNDRSQQQKQQNERVSREQTINILQLENEDLNHKLNHIMTEYDSLNIKFKEFKQLQETEQVHSDFSDEVQTEQLQDAIMHFSPKIRPTSNRNRIDSSGSVPATIPENQVARSRLDSSGTFASSDGGLVLFNELQEHGDGFEFDNINIVEDLEEHTPDIQDQAIQRKELIYDITLDGIYKHLSENDVFEKMILDLHIFIQEEDFDTESLVYDIIGDSNVAQKVDYDTFDLMTEYMLKDFKTDILNELKDSRYAALLAQLEILNWTQQQILCILRWLYIQFTQNAVHFNDLNESLLKVLCEQNSEILPADGLKRLNICVENIRHIHTMDTLNVTAANVTKCDIKTCKSLQCMIETLLYFDENEKNEDMFIIDYFENIDFVGNYLHLLCEHLNNPTQNEQDFQFMYKQLLHLKKPCKLAKCDRFKRKHETRNSELSCTDTKINDWKVNFYKGLLDSMHVFFVHSYDMGLRLNWFKIEDLVCGKISNILYTHIKQKQKQKIFGSLTGNVMLNKGKFCSLGYTVFDTHDSEIEEIRPNNVISFGHRHYYWKYFKNNHRIESYESPNKGRKYSDWYIQPKYENLKHELLHNNAYKLGINAFNDAVVSGIQLCAVHYFKRIYCQKQYHFMDIKINDPFNLAHLLSVIFHCNYPALAYNLRMCHYATTEEIKFSPTTIKQRNSEYYYLSRLLRETVDCFGTAIIDSNIPYFYHGIDTQLAFSSFISYFCGPTSTSTKWPVVVNSLPDDGTGMVLKLQKDNEYGRNVRYFDCCWISLSPEHDEKLFFGGTGPLQLYSLILTNTISGIKNYSFNTFKLLHEILQGKQMKITTDVDKKFKVINKYMEYFIYSHRYYKFLIDPKLYQNQKIDWYGNKLFTSMCKTIREIKIDLSLMTQQFKPYFLFDNIPNLLRFDFIAAVFNNCKVIKVYETGILKQEFINKLILNIQKIIKLKKEINCKLTTIQLYSVNIPFGVFLSVFDDNNIFVKVNEMEFRSDLIIHLDYHEKMIEFEEEEDEEFEQQIFENDIPVSYWTHYRQTEYKYFCQAKYKNIKDELLNNEIWKLSKNEFDIAMIKANSVNRFKFICRSNGEWNKICGIKEGEIISLQHILAIIVFTENMRLAKQMNKIRCKLSKNESVYTVMSRIQNFAHCFRLLCEAVILFGTNVNKNGKFYCGLEKEYDLLPFEISINQPTMMLNTINKSQVELFENYHIILQCKPINGWCFCIQSLQKTIFFNAKLAVNGICNLNVEESEIGSNDSKQKQHATEQKQQASQRKGEEEQPQLISTLLSAFI